MNGSDKSAQSPALARDSWGRRALLAALAGAAVAVTLLVCWYAIHVLLLIFAAVVMSNLFGGLAEQVEARTPLGYRTSFALILVVLTAVLALTAWMFAVQIADQAQRLTEELPEAAESLLKPLERFDWIQRLLDEPLRPEEIVLDQPGLIVTATGFVSSTFSALTAAGLVLFLAIFIGLDPQLYRRGILQLTPPRRRLRIAEVLDRLRHTLRWWLIAQFASMTVVGTLTGIGLALIGIPLAFILGVIAALLAFLPNIGPVISVIPAAILALAQGPRQALYVILLYIGVQLLESNLITPIFQLKALSMPPALTLSVQILLGTLTGFLGILVAPPLCATAMVLVRALYIEDALGDRTLEDEAVDASPNLP